MASIMDFNYTGSSQNVTLEPATYKLECWGAQGGRNAKDDLYGGKGGYACGTLKLTERTTLYLYVGGVGKSSTSSGTITGGYNGGGKAYSSYTGSGGGCTDIRLSQNDLYTRIIVAGGGGGHSNSYSGSSGGHCETDGRNSSGNVVSHKGTQESGGVEVANAYGGEFGKGGSVKGTTYVICGGGAGWYGGSGGTVGAGGSNYCLTSSSYKPEGYNIDEKYYLSETQTFRGDQAMPSPSGGNETGHVLDGHIKITRIGTPPVIEITSKDRNQINLKASNETNTITKIEIYVNDVLKQTSMDGFDNIIFTFDLNDSVYVLGDNEIKIIAYDEVYNFSTTHLENYKNIVEPPTIPDNPNLKKLIDIFDGVDSCMNYQLVELSNQLNNKGVDASVEDGMTALVNKVANIPVGRKWASGNTVSSIDKIKFVYVPTNSASPQTTNYYIDITNLDFKPSLILVRRDSAGFDDFVIYHKTSSDRKDVVVGGSNYPTYDRYLDVYSSEIKSGYENSITISNALIRLPYRYSNYNLVWYAYE